MASGRIKGITIEIDGNATKLNDALKGVDKQLSTTQRNLKDVNRLLKLDPGNTDLLKQKQKGLSEAVKLTKDRLNELKDAQGKVKEGTAEWDALQREIVATEQDLKSLENEYKDFGSVAQQKLKVVGDKLKSTGDKVKKVGENLTKYVTGPIAAIGTGSIAAWKEVDEALDTVTKKTGATGDALEEMQSQVREIATTMPVSFESAGTAIGEVNTRFGLTGDALKDLSEDFLRFAEINDTDVNTSIDTIQSAMAAFNTDTEKASQVLDLFTAAGQQTGIPIESLAESVKKNAVALQEMGFGLEDSVMFLAELDKNGVDSSATLTGLKAALKNATKEGIPMNEALADIQERLKGAKTDTEAAQLATELFGTRAGAAIAEYVRNGQLDFESLGGSLEEYSGLVTQTYEETQDPMDELTTAMNEIKDIGYEIAEAGAPMLSEALGAVRDIVQDLKDKWESLTPEQQESVVQFALVAAAVGPVLMVVGSLLGAIGSLITAGPILAGAIGAVVAAVGPVIAVFAGAVTAGLLLYKNWDTIKAKAIELKENVVKKFDEIKTGISDKLQTAKEIASNKWEGIKAKAQNSADNIKTKVSTAFEAVKTDINSKLSSAQSTVASKFNSIKSDISSKLSSAQSTVASKFDAIKKSISDKMDAARNKVSDVISAIKAKFNFSWSLPHLKLPHPYISGHFSLNPPSVPSFGISWYKKAYDNPVMFTRPTVLQTPSGLKGFGDGNGSEVVLSEAKLRQMSGDRIYTVNVYGAEGQSIDALAQAVQNKFVQWQRQEDRVYA